MQAYGDYNRQFQPVLYVFHNTCIGKGQVFFDRLPRKTELAGNFIILHSLPPAHCPYLMLLRRQFRYSLVNKRELPFIINLFAVNGPYPFGKILSFFKRFLRGLNRKIFRYNKQVGPEIMYRGQVFPGLPYLNEAILYQFLGFLPVFNYAINKSVQYMSIPVHELVKSGFISPCNFCQQKPIARYVN